MGGKTYNNDTAGWKTVTRSCGLEAMIKDPKTGKQMPMYIGEVFEENTFL
jgi:hypothetical protein